MQARSLLRLLAGIILIAAGQPALSLPAQEADSKITLKLPQQRMSSSSDASDASAEIAKLVRRKIKYVFVIYQENRSFDSYFGTYPGADGLYSKWPKTPPGFIQDIMDTSGKMMAIHPFRIGPQETPCGAVNTCFAADTDDVDHSHAMIDAKMDIQDNEARMDHFALDEEKKYSHGEQPSLVAKQFGELTMAYEDCDTVPLLWNYASKFVLFDHIFQLMSGPSTPGNLSIIGAQTGVTQWILHPDLGYRDDGDREAGVPLLNDDDPFWGSPLDPTPSVDKLPVNPRDFKGPRPPNPSINLTFATLPLSLLGSNAADVTRQDANPVGDLGDVKNDVQFLTRLKHASVAFGWYQEGYGTEPLDSDDDNDPVDAGGLHASYITHHNGPQYFGYISNNPAMRSQLHSLEDFFSAVDHRTLPVDGGVFYVKGGSKNTLHLKPSDPDARVREQFRGDDDHPVYSDAQISEAMVATAINKIAASPYWAHSAIIVTWDDSEGDYDHVPPPLRVKGPDGSFISNGPRVPLILISPYARTHYIAHAEGNHASVVKFIDTVFQLTPLAKLPDEFAARQLGEREYGQKDLGPQDALTPGVTDLLDAFSPARLKGDAPPLPAAYVVIPDILIRRLPAESHYGCSALGIVPTDRALKIPNEIPADFNPRPRTNPSPQK
jgi:phospholipase C